MKTKAVIIDIRVAVKDDFTDQFGKPRNGTMYFSESKTLGIHPQPSYLTENTDLETFRELFKCKQLWVAVRPLEEVILIEKRKPIKKYQDYRNKHENKKRRK